MKKKKTLKKTLREVYRNASSGLLIQFDRQAKSPKALRKNKEQPNSS